jgi:type VI secretion system protein ImpC
VTFKIGCPLPGVDFWGSLRHRVRVCMAKPFNFGSVRLTADEDDPNARQQGEDPFRILILGDFSGRTNRGVRDERSIRERSPIEVDRDNIDKVMSRLAPELRLPLGESGSIHLNFSELEDFHPDRLFEGVAAFEALRQLRNKLSDSATFPEAARELGLVLERESSGRTSNPQEAGEVAPSATRLASGNLLEEMIEETEARAGDREPERAPDPVRDFAQRVAAKYSQNVLDPRQPQVLAVLDRAIGGLMRAILHHPDFQGLEAVWRATSFLIHRLETNSQLKVYLLDISKDELAVDIGSEVDLHQTSIYRVLVESAVEMPGAEPWTLILGCYSFDEQRENAPFLTRMAQFAQRAQAPFIAEANPRLLGCSALKSARPAEDWNDVASWWPELRQHPEARYLALAIPRFLLRLPYGKETSALESFDFEEFSEAAVHEDYLWANPAFAVALLLGQSFSQVGWQMRPGMRAEIGQLPLHIDGMSGEAQAKPCCEVLLAEQTVEEIIERGFIPLVSFKNRDSLRIARIQSIADPARPLAGRWQW